MNEDDATRNDLVESQGVNAGSLAAERDRRPSTQIPVEPATGSPQTNADPADELVGAPGQEPGYPGQQLEAGEG
jgi:hypothetical protein